MLKAVTGVYENGQIELAEIPQVNGRARVIVTFLEDDEVAVKGQTANRAAATPGRKFHWQESRSILKLPDEGVSEALRELRQPSEGVSL